jgi:hypothetical protein
MKFKCVRPIGELERGRFYDGFKVDKYNAAVYLPCGDARRVVFVKMQRNSKIKHLVEVKQ